MLLPVKQIPEVAVPTPECPNPERWRCYDGMATEVEVLQFLYALVRMLKPKVCIETGTYLGYGSYHIGRALYDNEEGGRLYTAEPDVNLCHKARGMLDAGGLKDVVQVLCTAGVKMIDGLITGRKVDFAFLDSNLDTRIEEMHCLKRGLAPSAVIAVHDSNTFHDSNNGPRTPFLNFAHNEGYQVLNFDTPRGLMLLRKKP